MSVCEGVAERQSLYESCTTNLFDAEQHIGHREEWSWIYRKNTQGLTCASPSLAASSRDYHRVGLPAVVVEVLVVVLEVDVLLVGLAALDEEVGAAPRLLDCWPGCVVLPVACWPGVFPWNFELWCVPPTAPPTTAQMITVVITAMMVMPLCVRYHGTFVYRERGSS